MSHPFESKLVARALAAALTCTLVLSATASPATAGQDHPKPVRGSFVARGVPAAQYFATGCGEESASLSHHPFEAPFDGLFTVTMDDFLGDWDLWVIDSKGEFIGGSFAIQGVVGDQPGEKTSVPLEKGQRVTIVACNFSGGPEATVEYVLRFADLRNLAGPTLLEERVPVNFVFVGYEPRQVRGKEFLRTLPKEYRPIIRSRSWYGHREYLGIRYAYDYDITFADARYEDRLFGLFSRIGKESGLTSYQRSYNQQEAASVQIEDNLEIPATKVERWLAQNPPAGVDTSEYTVFYINWHGRKDFRHHVYTKTDVVDSDTGYNFGHLASGKLIAWGGSPGVRGRVWFHDLSAGPDWRTGNWNLDSARGYILPPVWEYGAGKYRSTASLSKDLALVARYVAIDLLFTTSPLYPPAITPDQLPDEIDLDINVYEGDPREDGSEYLRPGTVRKELRRLLSTSDISADRQNRDFFEQQQQQCYWPHISAWTAWPLLSAPSCYPDRPYGLYSNLLLYNALHLDETRDDPKVDYEASGFHYFVADQNAGPPYLGMADDNHRDGTQSFTYVSLGRNLSPYYGMTDVAIHEYGHHFGMSHPHDGYDYEEDLHFGPSGKKYLAWVGDESSTIMSYLNQAEGFSSFDRDNMARFLAATYVSHARTMARDVTRAANGGTRELARSDMMIGRARDAFASHQYQAAVRMAKAAYNQAIAAAREAGVPVEADTRGTTVDPPADFPRFAAHERRIQSFFTDFLSSYPKPWKAEARRGRGSQQRSQQGLR